LLNPAITGLYDGDIRGGLNYRTQWTGFTKGFNTYSFFIDAPLKYLKAGKNNVLSIGLALTNDKSGDAVLNNFKIDIPISFQLGLAGGDHILSIGVQPNYFIRRIDESAINFGNQFDYDIQDFNGNLFSGEVFNSSSFRAFDMNAGLAYKGNPRRYINYTIGVAINHLLSPKETFLSDNNILPMRITAHATADLGLGKNQKFHIMPLFLYMKQAKAKEMTRGLLFGYHLNPLSPDDIEIFAGVSERLKDAIHFIIGGDWNGIRLGMSYDYNTSDLKLASKGFGAIEVSLMYIKKIKKAIPPKTIMPCIRFY